MKLAIFLDVDKTITKRNIQEVYASEIGLKDEYEAIEEKFQNKSIDSAEFGAQLIAIFAKQKFSKTLAESFFGKVELRDGVDKLFAFVNAGVDIYLVSSGPNYYVDLLAQRKGIPADRALSSKYIFGEDGVVSKCLAVEDRDKVMFVNKNIGKYSITIGVGDNDRHDRFVDMCVIPMFMEPIEGCIHTPNFNAICTLVEGLLTVSDLDKASAQNAGAVSADDFKKLTVKEAISRFSISLWMWIGGAIIAAFMTGLSADWLKPRIFGPATSVAASSSQSSGSVNRSSP